MVMNAWCYYEKIIGKTRHVNSNNVLTMTDPCGSMVYDAAL